VQLLVDHSKGVVLQSGGMDVRTGRCMCSCSNGEFFLDTSSHQQNLGNPKPHFPGLSSL
jgi:hypothetical protein